MIKDVLYPIPMVFCDGCGKQINNDLFLMEKGKHYCYEHCKKKEGGEE